MSIIIKNNRSNKDIEEPAGMREDVANSYGFIKEEQLPQNRHLKRRKMLVSIGIVSLCGLVFGIIAAVAFSLSYKLLDKLENSGKNNVSVITPEPQPTGGTSRPDQHIIEGAFKSLEELYAGVAQTANELNPCMVEIQSVKESEDTVFHETIFVGERSYGFVMEDDGKNFIILAQNDAVVEDATGTLVFFANGERGNATVFSRNDELNLAILKVPMQEKGKSLNAGVQYLVGGESSDLSLGTVVIAIGCVNGRGKSIDNGFITAMDDVQYISDNSVDMLDTNILVHENSFGILVNTKGQMVGVFTGSNSQSAGLQAYKFSSINAILNNMMNGRPSVLFGAKMTDLNAAMLEALDIDNGIQITEVYPGTPAEQAGFRKGDIIVSVEDEPMMFVSQFNTKINLCASDSDSLTIEFYRQRNKERKSEFVDVPIVLSE